MAAGNLADDRAITTSLSTAMQSRVIHLEMQINHQEWFEDVAIPQKFDSRILAFLSMYPSKLMDFKPDHNEKTFSSPRTWEFLHKLIKDKPVLEDYHASLLAGTITSGVAVEFIQFTKVYKNLVKIADIIKAPEDCPVPEENALKWATIIHMVENVDEKNFTPLATYANRFDISFRILFFRFVIVRNPKFREHTAFINSRLELAKYFNN